MIKNFSFPITVVKEQCREVIRVDGTKEAYITAVASSDTLDSYWEYFAVTALNDMVQYARARKKLKQEEGLVELRSTHWSTFAIGTIVDGYLRTNPANNAVEFWVTIKLKLDYPEARELFKDVMEAVVDKQLSVGGWIDFEASEDAYELEWKKFIDEESDSNEVELLVGKINNFILEHVAVTLKGFAANDDTRFIDGMLKSLQDKDFQEYMNKGRQTNSLSQKNRIGIVERVTGIINETVTTLKGLQKTHKEEKMGKSLELAKAFLKSLVGKSDEEVSTLMKDSGIATILAKENTGSEADDVTSTEKSADDATKVDKSTDNSGETKTGEEDAATVKDTESTSEDTTEVDSALETLTAEVDAIKSTLETLVEKEDTEALQDFISKSLETMQGLSGRLDTLEAIKSVAKGATHEQGEEAARDKSLVDADNTSLKKGFWLR